MKLPSYINLKPVASKFVLITLFLLVVKVVSAGKEMVLAYRFGVSPIIDNYVLLFALVSWLPALWLDVQTYVYVPFVSHMKSKQRKRFNAELLGITVIVSLAITVLILLWISVTVEDDYSVTFRQMALGFLPLIPLGILVSHMTVILISEQRHIGSLLAGLPPLFLLLFVLFWPTASIYPLLLGLNIGLVLQLLSLQFAITKSPFFAYPDLRIKFSADLKLFFKNASFVTLNGVIINLVVLIDLNAARELGAGALAFYGYGIRVLSIAIEFLAIAVQRTLLPVISSGKNVSERKILSLFWCYVVILISLLGVPIAWIFTPGAVSMLFERGAFTASDTQVVTEIVRFGLVQVPFLVGSRVLVQFVHSEKKYFVLFISSLIAVAVKFLVIDYFVAKWHISGITLSAALMYAITFLYFWVWCTFFCEEKQRS